MQQTASFSWAKAVTELLFRLIRTAIVGAEHGGVVLGTTLEHPASKSAAMKWADVTGQSYVAGAA